MIRSWRGLARVVPRLPPSYTLSTSPCTLSTSPCTLSTSQCTLSTSPHSNTSSNHTTPFTTPGCLSTSFPRPSNPLVCTSSPTCTFLPSSLRHFSTSPSTHLKKAARGGGSLVARWKAAVVAPVVGGLVGYARKVGGDKIYWES